jgi:ABC-type branched-subunit amino acid transport system substrate-binding protein
MANKIPTPLLITLFFFTLVGVTGCERKPGTVLVGHLTVLSGPDSESGRAAVCGVKLAVDEINADPQQWIAGNRIAVMHADTKDDSGIYESQAVRMAVINKVTAFVGGETREQMVRLLPVAREYSLTIVSPSGTAGANSNAVALGLSLNQKVNAIAKFLGTEPNSANTVILADSRDSGLAAAADQLSSRLSASVVAIPIRLYKDKETLQQIHGKSDGSIVFFGSAKDLIAWKKSKMKWWDTGTKWPLMIFAGDETEAEKLCREPAVTDCLILSSTPATPPKSFSEKYKKAFGTDPPTNASRYYDAVQFLCHGAREAKGLTNEKLLPKLRGISPGQRLSGKFSVGPDQVAQGDVFVLQVKDGRLFDYKRIEVEGK